MAEHGKTDTPNVVDGKYTCDQVYWIPVDDGSPVTLENGEKYHTTEYLRFIVKEGLTPKEGDEYLADVVSNALDMTLTEFKEAFGFEDD